MVNINFLLEKPLWQMSGEEFCQLTRYANSGNGPAPASTSSSAGGYVMHTVRKGETLYGIANKYSGVSLSDIMSLNGLNRNSKIYVGQKLKIKKQ